VIDTPPAGGCTPPASAGGPSAGGADDGRRRGLGWLAHVEPGERDLAREARPLHVEADLAECGPGRGDAAGQATAALPGVPGDREIEEQPLDVATAGEDHATARPVPGELRDPQGVGAHAAEADLPRVVLVGAVKAADLREDDPIAAASLVVGKLQVEPVADDALDLDPESAHGASTVPRWRVPPAVCLAGHVPALGPATKLGTRVGFAT